MIIQLRASALGLLIMAGGSVTLAQSTTEDDSDRSGGLKVEIIKVSSDSTLKAIIEKDMAVGPKEVKTPTFAVRTTNNKFVLTILSEVTSIR